MRRSLAYVVLVLCFAGAPVRASDDLRTLVMAGNYAAIQRLGPGSMPELVRLYESADGDPERARVANAFYQLGWKSEDARRALMRDVRTPDQDLRISVQYALGRVSNDPSVVDALLENMQDDANPLFRDKAACALAYDQVHLSEPQKVRLFTGLIRALDDAKPQVRAIAIQALEIHTGQRKGFTPDADPSTRAAAVAQWQEWLRRYEDGVR
jgi:HEAT repeat protein